MVNQKCLNELIEITKEIDMKIQDSEYAALKSGKVSDMFLG